MSISINIICRPFNYINAKIQIIPKIFVDIIMLMCKMKKKIKKVRYLTFLIIVFVLYMNYS